jgi:hypothetical protein
MIVSWRLHYEPLCEIGRPPCPNCRNRAEQVLVKKKRGVKVMFIPVYRGSSGYAIACLLCSHITPIDDEAARIHLLRGLGDEYSRLYKSPHLQTAAARFTAARALMPYTDSGECQADVKRLAGPEPTEEKLAGLLKHCLSWRLSQAMGIPMADAEVIIYEDAFPYGRYVDGAGNALVDAAELDLKIQHVRAQAARK